MFHARLRLLLVPKGPILVRTQNLLVIAGSVSFDKIRLAFLDPLRQPPQGAEVCLHNDGGDVGGPLQDLIMMMMMIKGIIIMEPLQKMQFNCDYDTADASRLLLWSYIVVPRLASRSACTCISSSVTPVRARPDHVSV